MWFSSLAPLSERFVDSGTTIEKFHEGVFFAIVATFRKCMLRSVAAVLNRLGDDWLGVGGWSVFLICDEKVQEILESRDIFCLKTNVSCVSIPSSSSSPRRKPISKDKKNHCRTEKEP